MNPQQQINAIRPFGYTATEAAFIATAALHSGYFLRRQFNRGGGALVNRLCNKLKAREHATHLPCANNTHLYHIHAKPIYAALEQEDNRNRRPVTGSFMIRAKIMALDFVLAHPEYRWLPTENDKMEYFCEQRNISTKLLPSKKFQGMEGSSTTRYFIEKFPIYINPETGRPGFCYIHDGAFAGPSLPAWLDRYTPIIWEIRDCDVVYITASPESFNMARHDFARKFPTQFSAPTPEIEAYFQIRNDLETNGMTGRPQELLNRFRSLKLKYSLPKFEEQFGIWRSASHPDQNGIYHPPEAHPGPVFLTYHLRDSYHLFGTAALGHEAQPASAYEATA